MRRLLKRIEAALAAAAFAEEGDVDTARWIMAEGGGEAPAPRATRGAVVADVPVGRPRRPSRGKARHLP